MPVRSADAEWEGSLKDGKGKMRFGSGAFEGQYSFSSRFEDGEGTNPEELIAAAHSGCFSMKLSGNLTNAGFPPNRVHTTAAVHLEKGDAGFSITRIELTTEAEVPGIEESAFQEQAEDAKLNCPVSRLLTGAEITLQATLV
jgi:osmotically inducible protein OsmC